MVEVLSRLCCVYLAKKLSNNTIKDSHGFLVISLFNFCQKYVDSADGLLTESINRRGQEISYEYNDNYQVTREAHSDGRIIEYGYDAHNAVLSSVSRTNKNETTRFEFNQTESELSIIHPSGFVHDYQFDELGRKSTITIQDGTNTYTTNYSYDSLGRLDQLTDGDGNLIVDYDYHSLIAISDHLKYI